MEEEDLVSLFKRLGVSKPPKEGDGYGAVKKVHEFHSPIRFKGADDVTQGPLQSMMNNLAFRKSLGDSLASLELPYASFDRELAVRDGAWNAEELVIDLKRIILDRGDLADEGFYVTVSYARYGPKTKIADVHWIGLEFRRGTEAETERVIVYDPGRGGEGGPTWTGADPVQYGLLIPLLSDPEVIKAFGWEPVVDVWNDFGTRAEAMERAADMAIFDRVNRARDAKLGTVLQKLGARMFKPETTPCQVDTSDYFCQTWVLFLFGERSKGKSVEEIEKGISALCEDKMKIKRKILRFARSILESPVARDYWSDRRLRRGTSSKGRMVYTKGQDVYAWLKYSASLPEFGEEFLGGMCFENVTTRRGVRDPTEGGILTEEEEEGGMELL